MRILIGSPVRQTVEILSAFLHGIGCLAIGAHQVDYAFIDDCDEPAASRLLRSWVPPQGRWKIIVPQGLAQQPYVRDEGVHQWTPSLAGRVALLRNHLLELCLTDYDAILLVDSDLVLRPTTLSYLTVANKDIVAEVFWTQFFPAQPDEVPNVWLWGEYGTYPVLPHEHLTPEEAQERANEWCASLKVPGLYPVGGLGACTLISSRAIAKGATYSTIPNLGWWGEDRHFCVRAAAAGLELWADTHCPPLHLYSVRYEAALKDWLDAAGLPFRKEAV